MPRNVMSYKSDLSERRMQAIEALLSDGVPRSAAKISLSIFLDLSHCSQYMKEMVKMERAHIKKWLRQNCPLYLSGPGKNAPQPEKKTRAQSQREYHRRMRKNPEWMMMRNERSRASKTKPGWTGGRTRIIQRAAI